jgi:hypothetical protein
MQFPFTNSVLKSPKSLLATRSFTHINIGSISLPPHAARAAVCPNQLSIFYFSVLLSLTNVFYSHLPAFPLMAFVLWSRPLSSIPSNPFVWNAFASYAQPSVCVGTMASDGFDFTLGMFYSYVVLYLRCFALGHLNFSG